MCSYVGGVGMVVVGFEKCSVLGFVVFGMGSY